MNYIYLIKSTDTSFYKIGVSKNPTKRLRQHQTGNPSVLKLLYQYGSDSAYKIESILKRRYSHLKKEGEWYDLSVKEDTQFIVDCARIEKSLSDLKTEVNVFI